ncbi:hypothetical protein [Isoptericola sp. NPDC060257]|uniref:hypothetical protein n=1 Tax=Isoptericola sp. NPDC060257 TaxID=3347087 RepID=UPI003646F763
MVIHAVVDPDTPLLPPRSTQEKVDTMLQGLRQEPAGADRAARLLTEQYRYESRG